VISFLKAAMTDISPLATPLLDRLAALGIPSTTLSHQAVFTVAESQTLRGTIAGAHSKNLFVKDKKGRLFLVSAEAHARIDLKRLHETLGASGRLSFGSAELLHEKLGVTPGSVTAFAVINDRAGEVTMVLDANLMTGADVNFHPLINTATLRVGRDDFLAFLDGRPNPPETPARTSYADEKDKAALDRALAEEIVGAVHGPEAGYRITIQGDEHEVSIQTQDGQRSTAPDPDLLLEQTLGLRLPVTGLRYWVRGLPAPGPTALLQTDAAGRLTRLEQNGWVIEYPTYAPSSVFNLDLPERIVARRLDLGVKLVIEQWML